MEIIITIKQSKAKIFAWSIGLFLLSALIASAVSCFARETFHIICFAEKFAYFAGIQIFLYIPFLLIVIFYENQFIQISKEGLRFRSRLGLVRDIEFDHITGVTNTTSGLVVAVRGKPDVKMDAWRYKKSDMERVKTLLREYYLDAH